MRLQADDGLRRIFSESLLPGGTYHIGTTSWDDAAALVATSRDAYVRKFHCLQHAGTSPLGSSGAAPHFCPPSSVATCNTKISLAWKRLRNIS